MTKEEAQNPAEGKLKALQAAMSKIEKDFGKGSIMRMGDEQIENVEVIPSGSIGLDVALGVGGYPRGRFMAPKARVKQPLLSTPLPKHRRLAA